MPMIILITISTQSSFLVSKVTPKVLPIFSSKPSTKFSHGSLQDFGGDRITLSFINCFSPAVRFQ